MGSNSVGHQHTHRTGLGFEALPALSSDAGENAEDCWEDAFPASEVMTLALELTQT
jgi:hypothetical protein